jgi:DNA polymerase
MYGLTFDQLYADYEGWNGKERKGDAKRKRQVAKPGVLGAIYRLSGGMLIFVYMCKDCNNVWTTATNKEGDHDCPRCDAFAAKHEYTKKTGLWDYSDKMGVEMSQKQAGEVVEIFRNSYPEICHPETGIWKQLENAVADVMDPKRTMTVRTIGPNGCVVIDKINIEGRDPMMRMRLPSGRYLHYLDAKLSPTLMPWKGTDDDGNEVDVYRNSLVYGGTNQKTKKWVNEISTHGGKLFENLVQGIARDVLAVKLMDFEAAGLPIHGHVHDEGIALVENDIFSPTVGDMVGIMGTPIGWAPGLLLGADGFEEGYYHK